MIYSGEELYISPLIPVPSRASFFGKKEKWVFRKIFHFFFLFSSKTGFIRYRFRMLIFHHLEASTKAAPDIGGIEVRTPRNWNYFSKMNGIFGPFLGVWYSKDMEGALVVLVRDGRKWAILVVPKKWASDCFFPWRYKKSFFWGKWMENTDSGYRIGLTWPGPRTSQKFSNVGTLN